LKGWSRKKEKKKRKWVEKTSITRCKIPPRVSKIAKKKKRGGRKGLVGRGKVSKA